MRGSGERVLTDLVSLVRFALDQEDELVPTRARRERFQPGSSSRRTPGARSPTEQLAWLERIRDHVAASLAITTDDFDYTPFVEAGGLGKALRCSATTSARCSTSSTRRSRRERAAARMGE